MHAYLRPVLARNRRVARRAASLVLAAGLAGSAVACSSSSGSGGSTDLKGSITVYAASSLTGAFNRISTDFTAAHPGTTITFQFGSSGELATQITQGAPADVFASAAPKNMQSVIAAGQAKSSTDFVSNTAEIATAPGNPKKVAALTDLAAGGTRVALCVPTAPCGALAQQILQKAGVKVAPAASLPDVKSTLAMVESGEVDAGIVYVTDVRAAGSKVVGVPIPAASNGTTEYPIATLTGAKNPALASAFVAYVTSAAGLKVLTDAGFAAP